MTSPYEAARRVAAFLGRWELFVDDLNAAGNNVLHGVARNQLLTLDNNRYQLLLSDLRALVAAVPADKRPFMYYVREGRMWHVGCDKEVLRTDRLSGELLCECGRGNLG